MASSHTKNPGKAIYTVVFLLSAPFRLIFLSLYFLPKSLRQHPKWTWRQAFSTAAIRMLFTFTGTIEMKPKESLKTLDPGPDKEFWAVIKPAMAELYHDVLDDAEIHPVTIAGMWYTSPYQHEKHHGKRVVLHFHGGAYVVGGVRPSQAGWASANLSKHLDALVFCPQYRLSSDPNGRFPAALQDAVTSYKYLLDLGIPADSIVFSGDSAGANLALALLRYMSSQKNILPNPAAVLLWSPWVDLSAEFDAYSSDQMGKTDYIPPVLLHWGARVYKPRSLEIKHPYISPLHGAFPVGVPVFVQYGSAETLYSDGKLFTERMKAIEGNIVELVAVEDAPHDIFLLGGMLGWAKEAEGVMDTAKSFLDTYTKI